VITGIFDLVTIFHSTEEGPVCDVTCSSFLVFDKVLDQDRRMNFE
jgi:hypothetical protein